MNEKTVIFRKIDSPVIERNDSSSVIARSEATKQSQSRRFFTVPKIKTNLLIFILILFLITSFVLSAVAANSTDITMTNIWYKKLPNYTHLTIKASGEILDYEVSYLEAPERIIIDVKNANYSIDELVKDILFLNMGSVKRVMCRQFESEPIPITRFVVDLFQKSDYEVKLSSDSRLIYVDVYDYTEFKAPEEQIFTVTPVKSEAVKIEKEEEPKISILDIYTEPITLNVFEEDVVNVIRGLSELTGIDIMLDDSVTGQLTLNLKDKTFREAIELLMMNKGLSYTERSDTLIIADKDVIEGYKMPITKVYELKNASAEAAKGVLESYKTEESKVNIVADARMNTLIVSGTNEEIEKLEGIIGTIDVELLTRTFKIDNAIDEEDIKAIQNMLSIIIPDVENRVKVDNRQSEIIVKGTKEELKKAEELIPKLDKRATQMAIEIKFVEISLNDEKDLGIKWTSGGEEGQIGLGELTLGGTLERFDKIEMQIKALQTKNKLNMISNPIVYTSNGKKAFIHSGSRVPYEEENPEGGTKINWEDVGISMTITPWLSSDGLITMFIRADKSYLGAIKVKDLPVIETQEIGYKDEGKPALIISAFPGETKVIGGLIESSNGETIVKIPILGDIPIIGKLFQRINRTSDKKELIILITPHLLDY